MYMFPRAIFKYLFAILVSALLFVQGTQAQQEAMQRMKGIVDYLASDSLAGREAGRAEEALAAQLIAQEFRKAGLRKLPGRDYLHAFTFAADSAHSAGSFNVVGCIGKRAKQVVVVGAHYDHIGMGGKYSRSFGKRAVHPGADDNASGVALLLELARSLKAAGRRPVNYIFVAFGAHEPGLFGSEFFAGQLLPDSSRVLLMLNLDMVGRFDDASRLLVYESHPARLSDSILLPDTMFSLKQRELMAGDHTPFINRNIPAIRFTTGVHDDYHTVYDRAEKINYYGMWLLHGYLMDFLRELERKAQQRR